ncbi:S8 family peptidase [Paraflavitalea sp. CAU 1676]|uniref:S8 family peptidase n=1 Tax=Paraflavitalea sp. CAU 1676 TaxID=3032598 RepID=UPI0023DA95EF|nr:S8 family peptidase [Paraflavitalea sp. CAU 1676]MDF2189465.1 S8 family peptidase [Paraflavitalea sp. CAU 1676]
MKNWFTLIVLISLCSSTRAQYTRYIVRLADKKGTAHSLSNPATYLSAKAIARRTTQHIAIDSTDLPVSATYLDNLQKVPGVKVLNTSKWLNQVLIQTSDPSALGTINNYPFVIASSPLGLRSAAESAGAKISRFEETIMPYTPATNTRVQDVAALSYGGTYNQIHIHRGEYLHNHGLTGQGIAIAILDAGYRSYNTNPAFDSVRLQNRILGTWDYVNNEASVSEDDPHGAYCFSILAANRPGQIVGSAPHASYWLLRTENAASEYPVEEQYWAAAAEFADSAGSDMISSSLGYIDFNDHSFDHSYAQRDGNTSIVTRAADLAARKGIIVMNSAGNNGARNDDLKYVSCPADGDSVVAVGATTNSGAIASFSSWGPTGKGSRKPNIASVGQGTILAGLTGNPSAGNGTSFSNPNIAGLIACLWQAFPAVSNMQLIDAVQQSAHKYSNPDDRFGYGLPDFKKAMVSLIRQQAKATSSFENCVVNLQWTSTDDTSVVYTIARQMPGELTFTPIRQVNATSLLFKDNSYTLQDTLTAAGTGTAHYRIVQSIGTDTSFEIGSLHQAVNVICFPSNTIRIMPNPVTTQLSIIVNTPASMTNLSILVHDEQGRLVYKKNVSKGAGYFNTQVYTAGWQSGLYRVTLYEGSKRFYDQTIVKLP